MKKIFNFLKQLWTSSIRRQLMLGIILVHAVLMSIFVYDLVERQRTFLHAQSVEQAKGLATTLAVNSTSWVLSNDVVGLEEMLSAQTKYPALRYAMVLSPKGKVLGHTEIDKVGLYINDAVSKQLLTAKEEQFVLVNDDLSVDIASPINSNGVFIGWARVNLTQKHNATNLQIITRDGLLYTALAIVIGALFAFFMAKGITRGLKQIVDVAEGIKEGDQTLRADVNRHDEIGKLGQDFNLMLDSVAKSKGDLQSVMDNSPAVIYAKNKKGQYIFINQRWASLFDKDEKGIIGKTDYEIFDKDFADKFTENDSVVLETGKAIKLEESAPHNDGTHTYMSVKFPLRDENGDIYAVCGISTDITESINIKNEKDFLEKQLLHTQKMQAIGQLTGGIAHDFNNLLAVILGYAELSLELFAEDNKDLKGYLKEIYTAGARGRELVQQMMLYSRKDHDKEDFTPINIEDVLEETRNMLKATFPAGINIKTSVHKELPYVNGNSSLISQVLMNLCINAKDALNEQGEIFISVDEENFKNQICTSCQELYSGDYVVINIKDSGEGIDSDNLHRIFEPFFTSKQVGKGTGMGLSVVHGIVHKLGGHIMVASSVGKGAHIKILLPGINENIEVEKNSKITKVTHDFSGLNIMIVDDEPGVLGLLETSLKRCNAHVTAFTDSRKALEHFEKDPMSIDLVITDQTMPDLTGLALSEKLLLLRTDIKIILCTGHSVEATAESAFELGIKSFIHKPVKMTELYNIINELK